MQFVKEYEYFDKFLLKASRYSEFNDPFDLVQGDYAASLPKKERKEFYEAMEHLNDPLYHLENYLDIEAGARASIGVMCFTESYKNLLMWAHYANNHTGVCVGYDYDCNFFHNKYSSNYYDNVGEIRKVTYTKKRPKYADPYHLVNETCEWFKKSKEWKYEEEHRILLPIDDASYRDGWENNVSPIFLFGIEPEYIKKVILGCRMADENKKYIYEKLSSYDIQIIEAKPHPAHYKLTFSEYSLNNSSNSNVVYNLGMDIK